MCVGNANPHTHVHLIASSIAANQQKRLSVCHRDDRSSLSVETDRRLPRGAHTRKHARRCVTAACGLFSVIGVGVNRVKTTKWQMTRGEGQGWGDGVVGKSRKLLKDKTGSRGLQIRSDPTEHLTRFLARVRHRKCACPSSQLVSWTMQIMLFDQNWFS